MRILHVLGDSKYGGGSVIIRRLANAAISCGWQVDVLTTDPIFRNELLDSPIGVISLPCIWRNIRPLRDIIGLVRLYRFLKRNRYDLVHTHTSKGGFVGRLAARLAGVPVIVHTVHGFAFHEYSKPIVVKLLSLLEKIAAKWCDRIITVSDFHKDWAIRLRIADDKKIRSIPNGVSSERVVPKRVSSLVRREIGISDSDIFILSTGRLAKQKGFECLIHAIPAVLRRSRKPVKTVIVGDGPIRGQLEELIRALNLEGAILLVGFRSDVGDLLHASDVIVLPSLREGLSIALLEAMAAGKPIVTTSIGSNVEVTRNGDVAVLVPPKDPVSLANAIVMLIEDREFANELGRRALHRYQKYYTESRMLEAYIAEYEDLLKKRGVIVGDNSERCY